jgi:TolB-like protein
VGILWISALGAAETGRFSNGARLPAYGGVLCSMKSIHPSRSGTVRFGVYELDVRGGELRQEGVRVKLQEQPFHILQILLERPGEVVTREELRQRIWPPDTFVDFDHGINNAIKRLRAALNDSAETPRYIQTVASRGYRFIASMNVSLRRIESLAVLPLENLSRDSEQEYFAEGLTEELTTTLAKIRELRVVSRTSAMAYRDVHKPLREIARELGVDAIVEGTVLRVGQQVRVTAQLIDVSEERHLWAESYERNLSDVLTLQGEVAQAIAREVSVTLTPQEHAHFTRVHSVDPEAYESYLKGRYHWKRRNREGLGKALQRFQEAMAKDPRYAPAYSGFADCLSVLGWWGFISPEEGCGKAKGLSMKALELDQDLPDAHVSLAWVKTYYDYDFSAAKREFERAIELNPSHATAHLWFGLYLGLMGRHEDGYAEIKYAIRLDPYSMANQVFGFVLLFARRYEEAIVQFEEALDLDSRFAPAHWGLSSAYSFKSLHDLAIAAGRKAVELSLGATLFIASLGEAFATAGCGEETRNILEQLQQTSKQRYVSPYAVARIYAILGEMDEALRWLEIAYREHTAHLVCLKTDPRFDGIRSESRFHDLLRRMNFPM